MDELWIRHPASLLHLSIVTWKGECETFGLIYDLLSERSISESSEGITCACTDDGVRKTDVTEITLCSDTSLDAPPSSVGGCGAEFSGVCCLRVDL